METVANSLGQMLARTRERERAEELSRQQEILLGSVADGICGVDRNGLVRFANPAAGRLLGARPASLRLLPSRAQSRPARSGFLSLANPPLMAIRNRVLGCPAC